MFFRPVINLLVSLTIRVPVVQIILLTIYFSLICNAGSQNNQVGRHLRRSLVRPAFCSKQGKLWDHTRFIHVLSSQVSRTSKDGNYTTPTVKLFPCWAVLMVPFRFLWSCLLQPLLTGQVLKSPWLSDPPLYSIQFQYLFHIGDLQLHAVSQMQSNEQQRTITFLHLRLCSSWNSWNTHRFLGQKHVINLLSKVTLRSA